MPSHETLQALVRRGILDKQAAAAALSRQHVYGGSIDTVLLEQAAVGEHILMEELAQIVGIPLLAPSLTPQLVPINPLPFTVEMANRMGAVPLAEYDDALHVALHPEHSHDLLITWAAEKHVLVEPFLVTELRFRLFLHKIYNEPISPRYLTLLARLSGPKQARLESLRMPRKALPQVPVDPIETWLCAARLGDENARHHALQFLTQHLTDPRVSAYRRSLIRKATGSDPMNAIGAIQALSELRDGGSVDSLVALLDNPTQGIARAALSALRTITCEDFGFKPKRWMTWWEAMRKKHRVEWLIRGLAHREPELRLLASYELHELCGEYFGYHFDLPEPERELARQRFLDWWQEEQVKRERMPTVGLC